MYAEYALCFCECQGRPKSWCLTTVQAAAALNAEVPVVPAYVDRIYEVMPRFRRIPRPGRVTVTFGAPVVAQSGEDYDAFIGRVEGTVRALAGPKGIAVDPPGQSRSEGPTYWY
jgi:hypothetical protein